MSYVGNYTNYNAFLYFIGDLLKNARAQVSKTYDFKKGYSRSKSSSTDSDERIEEPEKKRKRL